jgi:GNAT superfamily N-acetyltransferase
MIIRLANSSDAATLADLRYRFRSITEADVEAEEQFIARCTSWMAQRLEENNWRCWVAERDESINGALWLQLIEKIPNPTTEPELHAYITNVFVLESLRGQGIGSQLLNTAIDFCKQQTVHAVILWPSERSRSLYERHGFAVREDLLELQLMK